MEKATGRRYAARHAQRAGEAAIADAVLYALRSEGLQARHVLLAREVAPRAGGVDVVVLDVGCPIDQP